MEKKNVYLADLMVGYVNLHNLHFNVVGPTFKAVHEYLEELYDATHAAYDDVAERIKMDGDRPEVSYKKYGEISTIEELEDKDYPIKEAMEEALKIYKSFRDSAEALRAEADEKDDFRWVALMEDQIANLDMEIWFMESALK